MARIALAYSPLSDAATLALGSYTAGLPRNNLKLPELFKTARTTDATLTSTQVRVDLGSAKAVPGVIFGPSNLTDVAKVRVRGAPSTAFSSGFDTGWVTVPWTAAEVDVERGQNYVNIFTAAQTYRYWLIEIDDTANPAGFVEIARLSLPTLLRPTINYEYGNNGLTLEDRSRHDETLGGVEPPARRRARRSFSFAIPNLPENEAFGSAYRFALTVGFDQQVFIIPDPDDQTNMQARAFWCRIQQMDPITQALFARAGFGLTVREWF